MLVRSAILVTAASAILVAAAFAESTQGDGDIVWRTYTDAVLPGDSHLTCTALRAEIARVGDDISMMEKARDRVVQNMHTAADLERYGGHRSQGTLVFTGNGSGEQVYAKAFDDIRSSKKVAHTRLNHLQSLVPFCRD